MAVQVTQRDEYDFALVLNFPQGDPNPTRIFRTAISLINEFADFDRELVKSIDERLTTTLQLEQVEEGSLRVWLRTALNTIDDDALKSGDWKKVVGNWLFLAKRKLVEYLDSHETLESITTESLETLRGEIKDEVEATQLGRLTPADMPPRIYFIYLLYRVSSAVGELGPGESASLQGVDGEALTIRPNRSLTSEAADKIAVTSSEVIDNDLILPIKKPDFIGDSRWEFILGNHAIEAKMLDADWLADFRNQKVTLLPGSSLSVRLRQVLNRGADNEHLSMKFSVLKVHGVVDPPSAPGTQMLLS